MLSVGCKQCIQFLFSILLRLNWWEFLAAIEGFVSHRPACSYYHCWQAMNQVDSHIPKLTIFQFEIKKRCLLFHLLWASCGDRYSLYKSCVSGLICMKSHRPLAPRECQPSWESPWWCWKGWDQVLSSDLDVEEVWPTVNKGMISSLGKSLPLYLFSLNASFHKECVYNFLIAGRHLVIETADWIQIPSHTSSGDIGYAIFLLGLRFLVFLSWGWQPEPPGWLWLTIKWDKASSYC